MTPSRAAPPPIVGCSPAIQRARELVERYAPTKLPILLVGPTGAGKELLAQHVHYRSGRTGEFVDVNCGALPRDMVESLLFGHRRGAFTGAVESTDGFVSRSHGGSLFLDELHTLSPAGQVKLLRVLETGEVQRLGEAIKRPVDLRVIAAVQEDVADLLESREVRRDLYQRLSGLIIALPPLSARPEDIVPLARSFAEHRHQALEPGTDEVLQNYLWPGNVRELKLAIERAAYLVKNGTLPPAAVAEAIELGLPESRPRPARELPLGREELLALCESKEWRIADVARSLGFGRSTVYRWLVASGIDTRRARTRSVGIPGNSREFPPSSEARAP